MKRYNTTFYCTRCGIPILEDEVSYHTLGGEMLCEGCYVDTQDPTAFPETWEDRIYYIKSRFYELDDSRESW